MKYYFDQNNIENNIKTYKQAAKIVLCSSSFPIHDAHYYSTKIFWILHNLMYGNREVPSNKEEISHVYDLGDFSD